jgi:subtilisin family serine protease
MRYRVSTSISASIATIAVVAALVGCARVSRTGLVTTIPAVSLVAEEPSSLYSLASSSVPSTVHESHTLSLALDRIDQRMPPLDRTYRHVGSGRGVTVYVFDGGVSTEHPQLVGRVRTGFTGFPDDPKVCNAHGTAVAGAIAGTTLGVAPDAEIVDVKMVQCEKLRGTIKAIVDGAHWVIKDHKEHPGPAVANWSFIADTSARIPALDSAVAALRANGIAVIVSAGNMDIDACRVSPGNSQGTIVVGASAVDVDTSAALAQMVDRRAAGTAWGPCIDLYAPGDSVLLPSLDHEMKPISQLWNGTSMAAGYVSGAAALFLEAHPLASPDQLAEALKHNATADVIRDAHTPFTRMLFVGMRQGIPLKVAAR